MRAARRAGSTRGSRRRTPCRMRDRAALPFRGALPRASRAAERARGTRAARAPPAGMRGSTRLRFPGRRGARRGATARGSRAVATEHSLLILQLAPVFDQVAVPADELGGLQRDHLGLEGLEALAVPRGRGRRLLFLLGLFLAGASFLLDEQVLDRLHVLVRIRGNGGG